MPKFTYCTNLDERGRECMREVQEGAPLSLCQTHLLLAAQFVREMGGKAAAKVLGHATGRAIIKAARVQVVYYLRRDGMVKIGTTSNLKVRLATIPHDELLAIEPGGTGVERTRHAEFGAHRSDGEWFRSNMEVMAHVVKVRELHGPPIKAWNRWNRELATRGQSGVLAF